MKHTFVFVFVCISILNIDVQARSATPILYINGNVENIVPSNYACENKLMVVHGNGIQTEHGDAILNKDFLKKNLESKPSNKNKSNTNYLLAYNPTRDFFRDILESAIQKSPNAVSLTPQIIRWIRALSVSPPSWFIKIMANKLANKLELEIAEAEINSSYVTARHTRMYDGFMNKGRKIVIAPHSQGNLFANAAYKRVDNTLLDSLSMVAVGSPDDYVPDQGPYTLLEEDIFMRTLSSLPWNVENEPGLANPWDAIEKHNFINSYMAKNSLSADKILDDITGKADSVTMPRCRTPLFTPPNSNSGKTQRVMDNGKSVTALDTIGKVSLYTDYPLIDWRGDYQNGVATKALSYHGPAARFIGGGTFANMIYRDGQAFYAFPLGVRVLGASITSVNTPTGTEDWMVAVTTTDAKTDTVYRRKIKTEHGLQVIDLYSGYIPDAENPNSPYWIKVAEIPHPAGSGLYSPWFFNGEGNEAQTIRTETKKLYFDKNECFYHDYDHVFCEKPIQPAGYYDVTVLNRYKLNLSQDLSNASVQDMGFETGNTGVLAVDYLDDQELILRERNTAAIDVPIFQAHWLDINNKPLLDQRILDCSEDGFTACRQSVGSTVFGPNFDGLLTGWPIGGSAGVRQTGAVDLNLYYADLRYEYFEFSKFISDYNGNRTSSNGDAAYYYSIKNSGPILMGEIKDVPFNTGRGYSSSPYGPEADGHNFYHKHLAPNRGQYKAHLFLFNVHPIGAFTAPPLLEAGRVIEPDGHYLISNRMTDGTTFNYYSKKDLQLLIGTGLTSETVLPVGLN